MAGGSYFGTSTLVKGQEYTFTVKVKNSGSSSWSGSFYLKSGNTNWIPWYQKTISAGSTLTLTGTYTPTTTGSHTVTLYYQTGGSGDGVKVPAGSYDNPFYVTVVAPVGKPDNSTFTATNITTTGFTAKWGAVSGATRYNLNVKKASESDYTNALKYTGITSTSAAISGLQSNTSYQFQVQAENSYGKGEWSGSSPVVTTLSAAPSLVIVGGNYFGTTTLVKGQQYTFTVKVKNTGTASWSGSFYLKSGNTNWIPWSQQTISAGSTLTLTGTYTPTAAGGNTLTLYYVTTGTSNGVIVSPGNYENPFNVTVVSPVGKPDNSTFTATNITTTGFTAKWGAVSGATKYNLNVKKASESDYTNALKYTGITSTSAAISGLQPSTSYQFQVQAENSYGKGEWSGSSPVVTTLSAAPSLVIVGGNYFGTTTLVKGQQYTFTVKVKNTGTASWSGAFYLKSGNTNWIPWSQQTISAGSTLTLTGTYTPTAAGGNTLTLYYVTTGTSNGVIVPPGNYENPFNVTVVSPVGKPDNSTFTATNITTTGFTAKWGAVSGATKYNLNVKKASESDYTNALKYTGITSTSAAISGLQSNTSYQFQVQAENSYGKGEWSGSSPVVTTLSAAPSLVIVGGNYFGTTTLVKGQQYTFTVKVKNTGTASWSGAFYLKSGNTNWIPWSQQTISAGSTLTLTGTYTPTAAGGNTLTLYYVTTGTSNGVIVPPGNYENPFNVTVVSPVGKPDNSTFTATNITTTGFTANWGAVTGATKYNVNVKKASESDYTNALRYTGITGTSASIGGLQPSTSYQFQVQAENSYGKGQWSASSSAFTTLAPAANLVIVGGNYFGATTLTKGQQYTFTVKVKNTGTASWSGSFYLKSGNTNWIPWYQKTISAGSTLTLTGTYTPTTTGGNTLTLYYQTGGSGAGVKVPAGSYENPFNVIVVSALSKPNNSTFTATNITSTGFTANWGAVSGATGYDILVKKATDANYNNPVVNGGSSYTSFDVVGLQPNTRYQFQVRAKNDGYKSEWSSSSSVITTLGSSSGTVDLVLKGSAGFGDTELIKGETYNYSTVVWNKSSSSWSGTLILKEGSTVVCSQTYSIPSDCGKPISMPYTPTSTGSKTLTLYYKSGSTGTVTIVPKGSYSNPVTVQVKERTSAYASLKMNSNIACSSTNVVLGNTVTLSASVKNEGSSWTGKLCISDNGTVISSNTYTIGTGVSKAIGCSWKPTTAGEHVIKVSYITANQTNEYVVASNGSNISSRSISVVNSNSNDTKARIVLLTSGLAPQQVNEGADVYYYYRVTNANSEPLAGVTATFNYTLNSTAKTPITSPASDADGIIMLTLSTTGTNAIAKSGQTARLIFSGMKNSSGTAMTLIGSSPAAITLKVRGGGSLSSLYKVEKVKVTLNRGVSGKYETPDKFLSLSAGLSLPESLSLKLDDSGHASEVIIDTEQELSASGKVEYSNCLDVNAEGSVGLKQHTVFNTDNPIATVIMVAANLAEAHFLGTSWMSNLAIQTFESWISENKGWLTNSIEEQRPSWFYGWSVGAKVDLLKAFPCNQGVIGRVLHMPGSLLLNGFSVDGKASVKFEPDATKAKDNASTFQYGSTSSAKLKVNGDVKGLFGVALFNPNKSWWNKSTVAAAVEGGLIGGALIFGSESTDAVLSISDEQWYSSQSKTTLSEVSNKIEISTGKKISFKDLDICSDWVDIDAEASLVNTLSHKLVSKGDFAAYLQQAASQSSYNRSLISKAFPVFTQEGIIASPQRYYDIWGDDFTNSMMKLDVTNPSSYSLENSLKVEQQNTSKADCKVTIPFGSPWKIPIINKPIKLSFDVGLTLETENYPSESYYSVPLKRFFPVVLQPACTIKDMAKEVTEWISNKIKNVFSNEDLEELGNISDDFCSTNSYDESGNLVFTNGYGAGGGGGGNWATRRLSSFAKRTRPALARMSQNDICRLSLSVNEGVQNFDEGTKFDYLSFYPAGGLFAVTNTGDTLFVLSDVTELTATYNNTSLKKTKRGKMKLETYVGADDLTPFGFPENTPLDILHANEGSDVWHYVGPAGTTVQVDSLGAYVLATSIKNDVVKPTILASLDEKNKVLHITVADNIGVRMNTLKVFINGELREMHVINEANLEVFLTVEDMKYRMTVRASVVDVAGNLGETTQIFLLDKPDKFDLTHFMGDLNRDGFIDVIDMIEVIDIALGDKYAEDIADLNYDGSVDVSDIIILIDVILGNSTLSPSVLEGDLNGDGSVDVSDLSAIINIVLGNQEGDLAVADLDNNGIIDVDDMNILIDIVLGKNSSSISLFSGNEVITVKGFLINNMMTDEGVFTIGVDNEHDPDNYFNGLSSHEVTLSSLRIGDYEVTQELWMAVMGSSSFSFTGNRNLPVKNVNWDDCQQFITRLNAISGKTFRLSVENE